MRVQVLSDDVVNKIAAGEVVERPASVVRELLDNAVDAGGTDICVELEEGGQTLVRITDNGCGMSADDAVLAFERHATSKIRSADDLLTISTLGFRGEALSSIAAVAKVELCTRTAQSALGVRVRMDGGKLRDVNEVPCNCGTTVEVRHLFFNTPARKNFLKSARSEVQRIKAWISHTSLAHPAIRIRLICDGKEMLNLPAVGDAFARARSIFKGDLKCFTCPLGEVELSGALGHPGMAQFDVNAFVLLVNGRVVQDKMLLRAVKEGFDSTLKEREFPIGFLSVRLPACDVDVNVHPQKSEVRFRNGSRMFAVTRDAVLKTVRAMSGATRTESKLVGEFSKADSWRPQSDAFQQMSSAVVSQSYEQTGLFSQNLAYARTPELDDSPRMPRFSDLRYVGQVMRCYLIGEFEGALFVVDMHAAHERYNYNLIRRAFRQKRVESQQLLVPVVVELGAEGLLRCMERAEAFAAWGFEWEAMGEGALVVRALPAFLQASHAVDIVRDLAAMSETEIPSNALESAIDKIAARLACHASIRAGRELEREEAYALFEALDSTDFSAACPHGRPVMVRFSAAEVQAWFGRDR
ncbi:MAG: DNA mismatch repair endonuclease MutL [Oligoflexia bacterium]|nr:DNA mismatch repair endonuclease MutL [Oligoflexia bacterium]